MKLYVGNVISINGWLPCEDFRAQSIRPEISWALHAEWYEWHEICDVCVYYSYIRNGVSTVPAWRIRIYYNYVIILTRIALYRQTWWSCFGKPGKFMEFSSPLIVFWCIGFTDCWSRVSSLMSIDNCSDLFKKNFIETALQRELMEVWLQYIYINEKPPKCTPIYV